MSEEAFTLPSGIPVAAPMIGAGATGDTAIAVEFLRRFQPRGDWRLSQIAASGAIESRTFRVGDELIMRSWIEEGQGKVSQYFTVNQARQGTDPGKKCSKDDIVEVGSLWVDVDPGEGEPVEVARKRIATMFDEFVPRPSIATFSGGGCQAFWIMEKLISVSRTEARDSVETAVKALERCFGADACHNVDRLMRLPGTVNVPNVKKLAKGRERARAEILWAEWDRRYAREDFREIVERFRATEIEARTAPVEEVDWETITGGVEVDALPVSDRIKGLIRTEHARGERSGPVFAVLIALAAGGASTELMLRVITDPALPISEHVREQPDVRRYALKQVRDARLRAFDPEIAELNEAHAVILVGGKAAILKEVVNEEGNPDFELLAPEAFKLWLRPRVRRIEGEKRPAQVADIWLAHRQRRAYAGITFQPELETPGMYNLWKGWRVEPKQGSCEKFLAHLRENVASGNEAHFRWIEAWIASIFQKPREKTGTSLVLRGIQGVGKTKVGQVLKGLLGLHYRSVSSPHLITGHFTAHMRGLLLLHADEGFWAGNKEAEGRLKDLITGDTNPIEYKGKDAFWVTNYVRLLVTGNPEWVVPAGMRERRFAVFEVSEAHAEDHRYFQAIDDEMENGGREALLFHLLNLDISGVDLRSVPLTDSLTEQKLASLGPEDGWWFGVLERGQLPVDEFVYGLAADECLGEVLFDSYVELGQKVGAKRRKIETELGVFLRKMLPGLEKRRATYSTTNGERRGMVYKFPLLGECRAAFEKRLFQRVEWPDGEEWE